MIRERTWLGETDQPVKRQQNNKGVIIAWAPLSYRTQGYSKRRISEHGCQNDVNSDQYESLIVIFYVYTSTLDHLHFIRFSPCNGHKWGPGQGIFMSNWTAPRCQRRTLLGISEICNYFIGWLQHWIAHKISPSLIRRKKHSHALRRKTYQAIRQYTPTQNDSFR